MSVRADYERWAPAYDTDRNITRDLDLAVTEKILPGLACASAVEFGCGTGKNTGLIARVVGRVLAFDNSEAMIKIARRANRADNISFWIADIEQTWPVVSDSQQLVTCHLVLQHVADLTTVFSEASRVLTVGGAMFVSELHPIKKYQGSKARYHWCGQSLEIAAFDHQISYYIRTALAAGLKLSEFDEWWHEDDAGRPPRLATFLFRKS